MAVSAVVRLDLANIDAGSAGTPCRDAVIVAIDVAIREADARRCSGCTVEVPGHGSNSTNRVRIRLDSRE